MYRPQSKSANLLAWVFGLIPLAAYCQTDAVAAATYPETPDSAASRIRLPEYYDKLPLSFEVNRGQTDKTAQFFTHGLGYSLFLAPTEAVLSLHKPKAKPPENDQSGGLEHQPLVGTNLSRPGPISSAITATLRLQLVDANPNPQAKGVDELPGKVSYFRGDESEQWYTGIPTYAKARYEGVYPGIDLIYYGNQRQLEYDFIVAPAANPQTIRLVFEGADKLTINEQGDLILHGINGDMRLRKPLVYQVANHKRQTVQARYVLHPAMGKGDAQVGFDVAAYDKREPLIIDPVLVYSTYLGGSDTERPVRIAVDSSGNPYVTGETWSSDFPTVAPLQETLRGNRDVFVSKLNAAGTALLYSTYLGGKDLDSASDIAVDSEGNAYVTGWTHSPDFPTAQPLQGSMRGSEDAFVFKLNTTGSKLVYSTYLGGEESGSQGNGIAVDSAGNAYVTGMTFTSDFATKTPYQEGLNGSADVFVTKLDKTGRDLFYSTYLGGKSFDYASGIAVDGAGNAYVTGYTQSSDFPTARAFQGVLRSNVDAFMAKLNATGSSLLYSTYFGGSGNDFPRSIAVDSAGNAYVTGETGSSDFPTAQPFQESLRGSGDAFVFKVNTTGSNLVYSTYLGGSNDDVGFSVAIDKVGNAYVAGLTSSNDFPLMHAFSNELHGTVDGFVTKLAATGNSLVFSSYMGGSNDDITGLRSECISGIAVDSTGNAYMTGWTQTSDFPTVLPFQNALGGSIDAFLAKISDATQVATKPTRQISTAKPVTLNIETPPLKERQAFMSFGGFYGPLEDALLEVAKSEKIKLDASASYEDECYYGTVDTLAKAQASRVVNIGIKSIAADIFRAAVAVVSTGSVIGDYLLKLGAEMIKSTVLDIPLDETTLVFIVNQTAGYVAAQSTKSFLAGEVASELTEKTILQLLVKDDPTTWKLSGDNSGTSSQGAGAPSTDIKAQVFYNPYSHYTTAVVGATCNLSSGSRRNLYILKYEVTKTSFGYAKVLQETYRVAVRPIQ